MADFRSSKIRTSVEAFATALAITLDDVTSDLAVFLAMV